MAILKVARLGHPVLRRKARMLTKEEIRSERMQRLIDDMIETMREYHGVGLAAPQIHVSKQIFVCEAQKNPRYPDAPRIPLTVVINPSVTKKDGRREDLWEGCLSIPDLRGVVARAYALRLEGLDRYGEKLIMDAEGFFARVIQHEWDHLQGHVYLDRMEDFRTLTHLEEFSRFWLKPED